MIKSRKLILIFLGKQTSSLSIPFLKNIIKDKPEEIFFDNPPFLPFIINPDTLLHNELIQEFIPILPKDLIELHDDKPMFTQDSTRFERFTELISEVYGTSKLLIAIFFTPDSEYDTVKLYNLSYYLNRYHKTAELVFISLRKSRSGAGATSPYYELITLDLSLRFAKAVILLDEDSIQRVLAYHQARATSLKSITLSYDDFIVSALNTLLKMEWNNEITYGSLEDLVFNLVRFTNVKLISLRMINQIKIEEKRKAFIDYYPEILTEGNLSYMSNITPYPLLALNIVFTGTNQDTRYFLDVQRKIITDIYPSSFTNFQINRFISHSESGQICLIENSTGILNYLNALEEAFTRLFQRKAFFHSLKDQNMTEEELLKMVHSLKVIQKAYLECNEDLSKIM